ncbi:MAG: hypothetical protein JWP17_2202 [Solirubrobacterales bacterium]|nr:hypothetical protein [Solirubrobacterales bacterium]
MEQAEVAATLRSFVSRSGAVHVVAATPAGMFGCDASGYVSFQLTEEDEPIEVTIDLRAVAAELDVDPHALPPFDADALAGEVTGPLGGLEHTAAAALSLSRALGAPTVVVVWLATEDDTELAISARDGEGCVVVLGDEQFEMDESWPPRGGQPPENPAA